MQYALRVSVLKENNQDFQWTREGDMTWLPPDLSIPLLYEDVDVPIDIASVDVNTFAPYNTTALIRLNNISLGVSDQLQVEVSVSGPLASNVIMTLFAVERMENYPPPYWPMLLDDGTWTLPGKALSADQNVSRMVDSLTVAFQLGQFFVGTMHYALRVSVLKENNEYFQWTREGDMTWLPPDLSIPPLHENVDVSVDIISVDINTSVPFNATALIRLNNISLGVMDQLHVEVIVSEPLVSDVIMTLLAVERMETYPPAYWLELLDDGTWTLPGKALSADQNESRMIDSLTVAFQLGQFFVGTMQYALRVSVLKENNQDFQWTREGDMTWLPPDLSIPLLHEDVDVPIDIASVDMNSSVQFNTTALIRLNNISLGITDQLQVEIRVSDPLASNVIITLLAVESMETYPSEYWLVLLDDGAWTLPDKALSADRNVSRMIDSLTVAFQLGQFFVGTMHYALRVSVLKENNEDFQWTYEGEMTWLPPDLSIPPLHEEIDVPFDVASVDINTSVAFNTSALIRLNNISLDVTDQLVITFSNAFNVVAPVSVTVNVVQSATKCPEMHMIDELTLEESWIVPSIESVGVLNMSLIADQTVAFNSLGALEVSNIALDITDQLQVEVGVLDPLSSNAVTTLLAVESIDTFPPQYWPAVLNQGVWTLPGKSLPASDNILWGLYAMRCACQC
ncbi:unnamed protein product [Aphanomyces euteiches]